MCVVYINIIYQNVRDLLHNSEKEDTKVRNFTNSLHHKTSSVECALFCISCLLQNTKSNNIEGRHFHLVTFCGPVLLILELARSVMKDKMGYRL